MKLISEIINDLVAEGTSTVVPLQKTKILASRLRIPPVQGTVVKNKFFFK
jgi:hypothetical protein